MMEKIEFDFKTDLIVENEEENQDEIANKILQHIINDNMNGFENLTMFAAKMLEEKKIREKQQENTEEFHKASRTLSHKFDLIRRQADSNLIQAILATAKKNDSDNTNNVVKGISKLLSSKKFVEVDRKILDGVLKEFSDEIVLRTDDDDLEKQMLDEALLRLQSVRDPLLR